MLIMKEKVDQLREERARLAQLLKVVLEEFAPDDGRECRVVNCIPCARKVDLVKRARTLLGEVA